MSTIVIAVLSSSFLAAIITAVISNFFQVYIKRMEYENLYFKEVINKRLEAYKFIEIQLAVLKTSVRDQDNNLYHAIFEYGYDQFHEFQKNLHAALSHSLWITNETIISLSDLNQFFLKVDNEHDLNLKVDAVLVGKKYYKDLAILREKIEKLYHRDMLELHKIPHFFKMKAKYLK